MSFSNRVTELLGVRYPIIQAPMGWIARAQLASAVSNAGGMGIIETSSADLAAIRDEIRKMHDLTDQPFGDNIALSYLRDPSIIDFVVEQGVRFVTTSAGDPTRFCAQLKAAGLTVFHVVPTLRGALKAIEAGVDGLIVEGGEGGGFKNQRDVASMVLLPLVCSRVDVPVVAAGGFSDGISMAAAFALGAEGIQMGTRMLSASESPVHANWKNAIVAAEETDTVLLNHGGKGAALRALRTERTSQLELTLPEDIRKEFAGVQQLYFGGDMEAAVPLTGQVCGRINSVLPVQQIIDETMRDFQQTITRLHARYGDKQAR
ncbi:MAG: nitronate monooxygenase [Sulfuritalea sp.]|nr:nitronate monooxygenase [Sulfuritalea sp.]